jgi:hypothetical protein
MDPIGNIVILENYILVKNCFKKLGEIFIVHVCSRFEKISSSIVAVMWDNHVQ